MTGLDFYDELGALFASIPSCAESMTNVLIHFLSILQKNEDIVSIGNTMRNVCYSFVEAAYFDEYKDRIVESLTEIGIKTQAERELNVIYTVLYFVLLEHPQGCDEVQKRDLLEKLKCEVINDQAYGIQLPALLLLNEITRAPNFTFSNLSLLDEEFIDSLLGLVEYTHCYDSYVIDAILDLLLCLISQYEKFNELNRAVEVISNRLKVSPNFREKLIFASALSRETEYSIVTCKSQKIHHLLARLSAENPVIKETPPTSYVINQQSKPEVHPILTQS
ncbi:pre-rRNA processing [Basidiobolus ranarum]|uniref:Pre-rRNA processing n=1 Tax=Basidiobolus ranarum TaxID=34480 RepID=A0ABR2WH19_9FUNG